MLELKNITKIYPVGNGGVTALNDISVKFRDCEFVSVLGPSGCGKTTLLNIIGGLDKYTAGDLLIDGKSTQLYKDIDWDSYRNSRIGFVFQSYNLIPHQTILGNVELALTLSGVNKEERRRRAEEALAKVGLGDQISKRPNQLSGGQLQRVAIARAIVNDPHIILADEPTGALDSKTSMQIMELLKEIASERLVIMVTHNNEIAENYSTRIIKLLDGSIVGDTNPFQTDDAEEELPVPEEANLSEKEMKKRTKEAAMEKKLTQKKTSMSFFTAIALSFRNLMTKKGRTFITSFAGSIGIIGVALVLAISNGFSSYINKLETETLSGFPLSITQTTADVNAIANTMQNGLEEKYTEFPDLDKLLVYDTSQITSNMMHFNRIDENYLNYIDEMPDKDRLLNAVKYVYGVRMNILKKTGEDYIQVTTPDNSFINTMLGSGMSIDLTGTSDVFTEVMDNKDYVLSEYDLIEGKYPEKPNDLLMVVDKYNRVSTAVLKRLGINYTGSDAKVMESIPFDEIKDMEFKLVLNDGWYKPSEMFDMTTFKTQQFFDNPTAEDLKDIYNDDEHTITLKVTGILRQKETTAFELFSTGLLYMPSLTELFLADCKQSELAKAQAENTERYLLSLEYNGQKIPGFDFNKFMQIFNQALPTEGERDMFTLEDMREIARQTVGLSDIPVSIYLYPKGFEEKTTVSSYLDEYNNRFEDKLDKIIYIDAVAIVGSTMEQMVDIIKYVLIAFAAVSLIVSSIMIGIITYVSVIERTKEIGVLRSLGARKKDVSRVFDAETLIIGFVAGIIGIVITYLLCIPINIIILAVAKGAISVNIAVLNPLHAVLMVIVSMILTLISGLIPASVAAKKDPVVALRTE